MTAKPPAEDLYGAFEIVLGAWDFPGLAEAVRNTRKEIDQVCADNDIELDVIEHVSLVASELVTNSIVHAATSVRVTLEKWQNSLRLVVEDESAAEPVVQEQAAEAEGGRGLHIVNELAQDWGFEKTDEGKKVWAAFSRPHNLANS
jgi:anti-sigma regulatory factor (Ser/Thr protein kinase)